MTCILFCKYIKEVLSNYYPNKRKLIFFDQCPAHINDKILNLFEKNNIDHVFFPKRMTCYLQPLDRAINYPFKKYLKHKYTDFILANNNTVKETMMDARKRIVNHILEIWNGKNSNNKDYISPSLIKLVLK